MWKFWTILATLLLAGAIYVIAGRRTPEPAALPQLPALPDTLPPTPTSAPLVPATIPDPTPVPSPAPTPPTPQKSPALTDPNSFEALIPNPDHAPELVPFPTPDAPPAESSPAEAASPAPALATPVPPKPATDAAPEAAVKKFEGFEIIPAKVVKRDDGSMLVDGKYIIKGEGTAEKPYIVTWELLLSVEEAFDPQNEKRRIPERIILLDGHYVRLAGFVAFPMTSKEPRELLSMLNQWDGCCIGTPPTPYDAVEVALAKPITGDDRFATTGRVTGIFRVKPYLQGDWLIGLYLMEDATLSVRDYGGDRAN